jgi:hypothetical protein
VRPRPPPTGAAAPACAVPQPAGANVWACQRAARRCVTARGRRAGFVAQGFWVTCLFSGRTYHLKVSAGEYIKVRRWDPGPVALAVTSLLSPVTVALLVLPWRGTVERSAGQERFDGTWLFWLLLTWGCGCLNYLTMILARRSEVSRKREREAQYAKVVDERASWLQRSRHAERDRFQNDNSIPATQWKDILAKGRDVSPSRPGR